MPDNFREKIRELEELHPICGLEKQSFYFSSESGITKIGVQQWQETGLTREQLLEIYRYMLLTRGLEEEINKLFRQGISLGKILPSIGNEAVAVCAAYALREEDWLAAAVRDTGAFLVRGFKPKEIIARHCGRTGSKADGWDTHPGDLDLKTLAMISHLGTMVPIAAGCSFAEKYKGENGVALVFVGEGATSTGDIHEGLNIASVLQIPMVMIVENNQWAFGTPTKLQFAMTAQGLRAFGYGRNVDGYLIDGTNAITIYATVKSAIEWARTEKAVTIIETRTMRLSGHSLADPADYVPKEQLAGWGKRDPLAIHRNLLLGEQIAEKEDLREIERDVALKIEEEKKAALEELQPNADSIEKKMFIPSRMQANVISLPEGTGSALTYRKAIKAAIEEEMAADPMLFIIGEDIGISGGAFRVTDGLLEKFDGLNWADWWNLEARFPQKRVIDAPLAESGFTGLALGAVQNGLKAIVEYQYADFSSPAFKMIVNYAAAQIARGMGPLHIVFRMPSGWARHVGPFHAINPESWFASTPGLKIVAPITAFDAKGLLKSAVRDGNPVIFQEYRAYYNVPPEKLPPELNLAVPDEEYFVPIGKARVVKDGNDLTVITYGSQVVRALAAAKSAAEECGSSIEVIDLRTLVPYDKETIAASVKKTSRALVTSEAQEQSSFGNEILKYIAADLFDHLDAAPKLIASLNTQTPFASTLENAFLPTEEKLKDAMKEILSA